MTGKEHLIIGITAATAIGLGLLSIDEINNVLNLGTLVIGSSIGSLIPDIDIKTSIASNIFNKILSISLMFLFSYIIINDVSDVSISFDFPVILFFIITIISRSTVHRSFTHKWLGTILYCYSVYLFNNLYLFIGFTCGYLLHVVCDIITSNGYIFDFFKFKFPLKKNAKEGNKKMSNMSKLKLYFITMILVMILKSFTFSEGMIGLVEIFFTFMIAYLIDIFICLFFIKKNKK